MRTLRSFIISLLFIGATHAGFAQVKTEKIKVPGECGMCKKKIESAARKGGASYASWNSATKELSIKYNSGTSDVTRIQKAIAASGYDTPAVKAEDKAYDQLDDCCKYERTAKDTNAKSCCSHEACADSKCAAEENCTPEMSCCKESGCDKNDCCKKNQ